MLRQVEELKKHLHDDSDLPGRMRVFFSGMDDATFQRGLEKIAEEVKRYGDPLEGAYIASEEAYRKLEYARGRCRELEEQLKKEQHHHTSTKQRLDAAEAQCRCLEQKVNDLEDYLAQRSLKEQEERFEEQMSMAQLALELFNKTADGVAGALMVLAMDGELDGGLLEKGRGYVVKKLSRLKAASTLGTKKT
jgi:DNA repair exonuclease SbcCD ATPase subunit